MDRALVGPSLRTPFSQPQVRFLAPTLFGTRMRRLVWASPMRKDQTELRAQIDNAIKCIKSDGTMAAFHEKWFGIKPATGSAAVTIYPGTGVPGMPGYDPTPTAPKCS